MAMSDHERTAFERLVKIARSDTGQSRRVAAFILAWWNAGSLGGFDLADLFGIDQAIAADMGTVFICLGSPIRSVLSGRLSNGDRGSYRGVAA